MIGKYLTLKDYTSDVALLRYVQRGLPEGSPQVPLFTNLAGRNISELSLEIAAYRSQRPRLKKAGVHLILSHSPEQRELTIEDWREGLDIALKEFGAETAPYAAWLHTEKAHKHIHVFFLRIRHDGSVVSDSNSYRKAECAARRIEQHLGLNQPTRRRLMGHHPSPQGVDGKRASHEFDRQSDAQSDQDFQQRTMRGVIDPRLVMSAVDSSLNFEELRTRLAEVGIETNIKHLPGGAEPVGWSMRHEGTAGRWIKSSGVHPDLSLQKVLNRMRERQCKIEKEAELERRQRTRSILAKRRGRDHSRRILKIAFSKAGVMCRDRPVAEDANMDALAAKQTYSTHQAQPDDPETVELYGRFLNGDSLEYSLEPHHPQPEQLSMSDLSSAKVASEAGAFAAPAERRLLPALEFQVDQFARLPIIKRFEPETNAHHDQHGAENEDLYADEDGAVDEGAEDSGRYERERFR